MIDVFDDVVMDDEDALLARDSTGLLRATASAGAQVRLAAALADEVGVPAAAPERPRALVIVGHGEATTAAQALMAITGPGGTAPVVVHTDAEPPTWVGAADAVLVLSADGADEASQRAVDIAGRRGAAVVGVGVADAPMARLCAQVRAPYVGLPPAMLDVSAFWAHLTVALAFRSALAADAAEGLADVLDGVAQQCRPASETFVNPGKLLALELSESLPVLVGDSPLAEAAAARVAQRLFSVAGLPAVAIGVPDGIPAVDRALTGPLAPSGDIDFFRDRTDDAVGRMLRLVLFAESATPTARQQLGELAERRSVGTSELAADGADPLSRLATLVAPADFAAAYLALGQPQRPTGQGTR